MWAHGVVKDIHIGEEICLSGTARVVATQMNQFTFQAVEEVLGLCVVVRVTLTGLADSQGSQPVTEGYGGGRLDAPVTVKNLSRAGPYLGGLQLVTQRVDTDTKFLGYLCARAALLRYQPDRSSLECLIVLRRCYPVFTFYLHGLCSISSPL